MQILFSKSKLFESRAVQANSSSVLKTLLLGTEVAPDTHKPEWGERGGGEKVALQIEVLRRFDAP